MVLQFGSSQASLQKDRASHLHGAAGCRGGSLGPSFFLNISWHPAVFLNNFNYFNISYLKMLHNGVVSLYFGTMLLVQTSLGLTRSCVVICGDCVGLNNEPRIRLRRGCCSFKPSKGSQPFSINCSHNPCHNSLYGAAFFLLVAMTTAALHHSSALVLGCIASPSAYSEMFRGASVNHSPWYTAPLRTCSSAVCSDKRADSAAP